MKCRCFGFVRYKPARVVNDIKIKTLFWISPWISWISAYKMSVTFTQ